MMINSLDIESLKEKLNIINQKVSIHESDINLLLGIKKDKDNINQYRNPRRFESYSYIAKYRFINRILGVNLYSYFDDVHNIIEKYWLFNNSNNFVEFILPQGFGTVFSNIYLSDDIRKKIGIYINYANNKIRIDADSSTILSRFTIFLLCDFIDLSIIPKILGSKEIYIMCLETLLYYINLDTNKINFFIDKENISRLLLQCGYVAKEDKLFIEPYRSEVKLLSDVIYDMTNMSLCWPIYIVKQYNDGNFYLQLSKMQDILYIKNYSCYGDITINDYFNCNKIEDIILKIEINNRNIRYPHKFFSFVTDVNQKYLPCMVAWACGNKLDINSFSVDMKQTYELFYDTEMEWDPYGELICCYNKGTTISKMWIVNNHDDILKKYNIYNLVINIFWGGFNRSK